MSASDPRRAVISRLSCEMLDALCRGFLPETQLSSRCKSDMLDAFCTLARDEVIQMVYELASCEATESTDSDFGRVGRPSTSYQPNHKRKESALAMEPASATQTPLVAATPLQPLSQSDYTRRAILSQLNVADLVPLLRHCVRDVELPSGRKQDLLDYLFQKAPPAAIQTVVDVAVSRLTAKGELDTSAAHDPCRFVIAQVPLDELVTVIRQVLPDVPLPGQSKTELLDFFFQHVSPSVIETVVEFAETRAAAETVEDLDKPVRKRRRRNNGQNAQQTPAVVETAFISNNGSTPGSTQNTAPASNSESQQETTYFELSSDEQTKQCYREYYDTTHPKSLKRGVCAVCAGELDVKVSQLKQYKLEDIPNINRLRPHLEHEAHTTYNGALLEPSGVFVRDNITVASICSGCFRELSKPGESPPRHSLANNLWVGPTPWELSRLTVPEQLLIALLYPRVFVYKLHNKTWRQQDTTTLQRGMWGTVCTYELNTDSIASMVQGNLMPRPPAVLSSTIVITFIGREKLTLRRVHSLFQVRRHAVLAALLWLKRHNTQYYGDVVIDADRLDNLPVDGIPEEIVSTMRHIADESLIEQESAPYAPSVDDGLAEAIYGQEDGNSEGGGPAG
ncbi:hypothetical protein BGW80DRAFT_1256196 [Lactifluus volemus]|nr:hypothetical protein BGW80DRAFT_1256196 [Lactifluus volemus]